MPQREQRKTVTVLFCDVTGSTQLGESTDPEALRALLARYFERMKSLVESHGGTVEKFIGDAVMAVFGVPQLHEDDALRAVRAAVEMREALPELGVQARIGVNTGEVVTGTQERLATGDAVNVAARLEQAAQPGEILVGGETLRLVRAAVEVGAERLLELKGKAEPLAAYTLESVLSDTPLVRHLDVPIVGRERERRALRDAWDRARSERACHLFTVLGAAGVGKSRLTAEFLDGLSDAEIVRGRCLPYGEGITYWPVIEAVLQLGRRPTDVRAASAIASLLGEEDAPASADDIAWAFRKLLEEAAPVVCVFDDIHWAEQTLFDLIDHVADWSREAPILLLCLARPELLDVRAGWAGGKLNATTVLLEPLTPAETDELIEQLLGEASLDSGLRDRIRDAAEGNPLFVEEMLALVTESPDGEITIPPTIQALLSARLDQLEAPERSVLERGAIEGNVFHRSGVVALAPEEERVEQRLMALVRKELVRPTQAQFAGDDAFRFRHLLIRDAAYDALPKAGRAELHERFADWLTERASDFIEYDEIAGYHLEQAHRYRVELGLVDERTAQLGARASERLAAAAQRAFARRDVAAARLLTRALALLDDAARPLELELTLIEAHRLAGEFGPALEVADALIERAVGAGDRATELRARLARTTFAYQVEALSAEEIERLAREALEVFGEAGDDAGLAEAWVAITNVEHLRCRFRARQEANARAREHALRAGNTALAQTLLQWRSSAYANGPFPVAEGLAWFDEHADLAEAVPSVLNQQALLEAMRGDFARARDLLARARENAAELGQQLYMAGTRMTGASVEFLAGDFERSANVAVSGCSELEALGERGWLSTLAGQAGQALVVLGRDDEAWDWAAVAEEAGADDDVLTQTLIRQVRARVLSHRGEHAEAERLAREAVALGEPTDMLSVKAEARVDLAEVLAADDRADEAGVALEQALELLEEKGNLVMAERTRARLETLRMAEA